MMAARQSGFSGLSRVQRDGIALVIIALVSFGIAHEVELFERVYTFSRQYERWGFDEGVVVAATLTLGLVAFSMRRWQELRVEVAARQRVEDALRQSHATLEVQVAARTATLEVTNEALHREVAARQQVVENLQAAKEAAEVASRAKSHFLATMSHELRTPLTVVIGYCEMLQEEARTRQDAQAGRKLAKIEEASKHLLAVLGDILELSRLEAGGVEVAHDRLVVEQVVEAVALASRPLVEQGGNTWALLCPDDAGEIDTDEAKLRQILLHLVGNAIKFTQAGTITLAVTREGSSTGEWMCFQVRDTGIGMTPAQLDMLFQPFVQGDMTTTRRYGGSGLGLAISQRLASLLGGTLTVESAPEQGSCFELRLPAG